MDTQVVSGGMISKLMDGAFWLYNDFLDGEQKLFLKIIVICYFSQ